MMEYDKAMDMYVPNIHIERSYAEHDVASLSDPGRLKRFREKLPGCSFNVPYIGRILLAIFCGMIVLTGGVGLCLISYYATLIPSTNSTANYTVTNVTINYAGFRSCTIIGSVFMAIGFFIMMISCVIYMELRDKYYRFLPTEKIKNLPDKQIFELILQQFRRSYFHGVPLPIGKPSAATNTYPAGINITENTDDLLERLSPRFQRAEREADEALRIPHDSEVTLAYLAHVPGDRGTPGGLTTGFVNKNLYSPFNVKNSYTKCPTKKSTLSLKNKDERKGKLRDFGERKSYSLDVPKPSTDGSHENLAYARDDDLALPPATSLRRLSASRAISSDNESNTSESRYPSVIVHEAAVHRRGSYGVASRSLDVPETMNERRSSNYGAANTSVDKIPSNRRKSEYIKRPKHVHSVENRRRSEYVIGSGNAGRPSKDRRRSEYGVIEPLDGPSRERRRSEYGLISPLGASVDAGHRRDSEYGIIGSVDQPTVGTGRRCSTFGIMSANPNTQFVTDNSLDTDSSSQSAYKTIVNIAPTEMIQPGTFTGQTDRRKSLVSQCSVCNSDILIDFHECEKSSEPVEVTNTAAISASKSSSDIYTDLLQRPTVAERRSSFRKTHSKGNLNLMADPWDDSGDKRATTERRVSFDPRTAAIERSRSCSSKFSIDDSSQLQSQSVDKPRYMPPRSNSLKPPSFHSSNEFAMKHASSGSIDRFHSSLPQKRNFLSPNDTFDDSVFMSQRDLLSPLVCDRQSATDLHRPINYRSNPDQMSSLSERRGSFDPRTAYSQSGAGARRKSFVGSDSDSMEFRISIDRVDDDSARRPKRRGRSLQVRSSRSKIKQARNKSMCAQRVPQKSSITFKCGIAEIHHDNLSMSMSQDDAEPIRRSTNFLTPDYQPR